MAGGIEDLFRAHWPLVLGYLARRTGSATVAEELAQETFYRATRAFLGWRGGSPAAWLLAIARNVLVDEARRGQRFVPLNDVVAGDLPRAKDVLFEIHESATRSKAKFFIGASERGLADIALAEGDPPTALHLLGPAIETLRTSRSENELALALGALGRARRLRGNEAEAHADLEEAAAILDRLGTLEEPGRLRGELAARAI